MSHAKTQSFKDKAQRRIEVLLCAFASFLAPLRETAFYFSASFLPALRLSQFIIALNTRK